MRDEKELREQLKEKYGDEQVFIVPKDTLPMKVQNNVFIPCNDNVFTEIARVGFFMPRYEVEYNPSFKQIITYAIVRNNGKYLATRRLKGDDRLRSMISLGIGGHISPDDYSNISLNFLENSLQREVMEELDLSNGTNINISFMGLMNDNSSEVSQDHLGLIFNIDITSTDGYLNIKEVEKLEPLYLDQEEILHSYDLLENWSKIYVDHVMLNWGLGF